MQLNELFFIKYIEAIKQGRLCLQDDGEGVYIKYWDPSLGNIPTQKDIDNLANDVDVVKHNNELSNNGIYEKLYEIDLKSIRALRTGDTSRLESLEQEAIALREQLVK